MSRITKIVLGGALAFVFLAALAVVGLVAGVSYAQGPTATPSPQAPATNYNQTFWESLASRLGVTVDRLQQAFKDAAKDTVGKALQDNQITQDEANRINQRVDQWQPSQGEGPFELPFERGLEHGRGHKSGLFATSAVLDAAAQALGMTTADLTTQLRAGKTLADVAKDKNADVNTVKQAMVNAAKAQVDQEVQAGRLTQDQASQLKQRIDQEAANLDLSKPFVGRGGLWRDHDGFPFAPGRPQQPAPQTPATPSASGA